MSKLVDRLRSHDDPQNGGILFEAAEEIDRLQTDVERMTKEVNGLDGASILLADDANQYRRERDDAFAQVKLLKELARILLGGVDDYWWNTRGHAVTAQHPWIFETVTAAKPPRGGDV